MKGRLSPQHPGDKLSLRTDHDVPTFSLQLLECRATFLFPRPLFSSPCVGTPDPAKRNIHRCYGRSDHILRPVPFEPLLLTRSPHSPSLIPPAFDISFPTRVDCLPSRCREILSHRYLSSFFASLLSCIRATFLRSAIQIVPLLLSLWSPCPEVSPRTSPFAGPFQNPRSLTSEDEVLSLWKVGWSFREPIFSFGREHYSLAFGRFLTF